MPGRQTSELLLPGRSSICRKANNPRIALATRRQRFAVCGGFKSRSRPGSGVRSDRLRPTRLAGPGGGLIPPSPTPVRPLCLYLLLCIAARISFGLIGQIGKAAHGLTPLQLRCWTCPHVRSSTCEGL